MCGGKSVCRGLGWEGSWFKPRCGQNLGEVLVAGRGARTNSVHCRGTFEYDIEPGHQHSPVLTLTPIKSVCTGWVMCSGIG